MTIIHCYTCDARLEDLGFVLPRELAAKNNWIFIRIGDIEGYLCEQCYKWLDNPIRIWQDQIESRKNSIAQHEFS